jgi:hypothetical protein
MAKVKRYRVARGFCIESDKGGVRDVYPGEIVTEAEFATPYLFADSVRRRKVVEIDEAEEKSHPAIPPVVKAATETKETHGATATHGTAATAAAETREPTVEQRRR